MPARRPSRSTTSPIASAAAPEQPVSDAGPQLRSRAWTSPSPIAATSTGQPLLDLHGRVRLPERARLPRAAASTVGDPHHHPAVMEELKAEARKRGLWNLFQPHKEWGPGPDQRRVRAAGRDHGPQPDRQRGVQLLGARHRQHGGADDVRHRRAEGHVVATAAGRRDPLGVRHDRARRRVERRHEHRACASSATATTTC